MAATKHLADILDLAEIARAQWPEIRAGLHASGVPLCEGDDAEGSEGEGNAGTGGDDGDGKPAEGAEGEGGAAKAEPDWKRESRKHEARAKAERKRREELERKLSEQSDAEKSEHEKAIEQARKEAADEARTEAEKERRRDRLEVQVARLAAKSFADVDDALLHVERRIASGDIDADTIFDEEGKVHTDALKEALDDLLEAKPHLKAEAGNGGRPSGSADAGKGKGGAKDLEAMSIDDHFASIRRHK